MHARVVLGVGKGARFKECPHFRSVLIRGSLQKQHTEQCDVECKTYKFESFV